MEASTEPLPERGSLGYAEMEPPAAVDHSEGGTARARRGGACTWVGGVDSAPGPSSASYRSEDRRLWWPPFFSGG